MIIKQERSHLIGRYANQQLMYPGVSILTWLLVGSVWHLVKIESEVADV